ncbi:MAG: VacJ family lipoprotein [Pseudomonadota bacterium]
MNEQSWIEDDSDLDDALFQDGDFYEDIFATLPNQNTVQEEPAQLEIYNRWMLDANLRLDRTFIRPVSRSYSAYVPKIFRDTFRNFLDNLTLPASTLNNALQGDIQGVGTNTGRFLVNSIFGIGGLFDLAKTAGLYADKEDFGQTLATYGTPSGPYLMLPVFGPSNPRDTVGLIVDAITNPTTYLFPIFNNVYYIVGSQYVDAVDARSRNITELEDIERNSLDAYAAIRSVYWQMRLDAISR